MEKLPKTSDGDLIIPLKLLRDKNLTANEKFYVAQYIAYDENIIKTDDSMHNLSKYQLRKIKKRLLKLGYIRKAKQSKEELKNKTIKLSHKGKKCEWCDEECYILHKHHFPVSQKDGGKETVEICPNCHCTFHKLTEDYYE